MSTEENSAKFCPRGFIENTNLAIDDKGRLYVKDGRGLEEYINNPELCKLRAANKGEGGDDVIITQSKIWNTTMEKIMEIMWDE